MDSIHRVILYYHHPPYFLDFSHHDSVIINQIRMNMSYNKKKTYLYYDLNNYILNEVYRVHYIKIDLSNEKALELWLTMSVIAKQCKTRRRILLKQHLLRVFEIFFYLFG